MKWIIYILFIAFLFAIGLGGAFMSLVFISLILLELIGIIIFGFLISENPGYIFLCLGCIIALILTMMFGLIPSFGSIITWFGGWFK